MAFSAGYNAKLMLAGYDLSGYLNKIGKGAAFDKTDTTCFGASWRSFLPTLQTGQLTCSGFSDNSTGAVTAVLGSIFGTNSKIVTAFDIGDTFGNLGWGMSAQGADYDVSAPVDGVTEITATFAATATGLEPIYSLRALAAATGTGNGSTRDHGAATSNGGAGYLQVTAFSGTNITVSINHSTDNFAANDVQLLTFAQVSAANGAQRVAFTGTANRYRRIVIAGTFTSVTFQVGLFSK